MFEQRAETEPGLGGSGLKRRTMIKAAAWAAPALMIAAPAPAFAAASVCSPSTNLQGLKVGSSPSSIPFYDVNGTATGVTASLSYTSSGQGGDNTPGNTGKVAQTTSTPSWKYIELQMVSNLNKGDYVEITLTFNQPVTGLSFIVHDIDKVSGQWVDEVIINSPSGYTHSGGSAITGTGTSGNPFTSNVWGDLPIATGQGSVRVTYADPVQTVKIRYRAGANGNASSQHVGLGDLSYNTCVTPTGKAGRVLNAQPGQQTSEEAESSASDTAAGADR